MSRKRKKLRRKIEKRRELPSYFLLRRMLLFKAPSGDLRTLWSFEESKLSLYLLPWISKDIVNLKVRYYLLESKEKFCSTYIIFKGILITKLLNVYLSIELTFFVEFLVVMKILANSISYSISQHSDWFKKFF